MEDKVVKPGLYAYQFRVDISIETGKTKVMEFITKYKARYYIVGAEKAKSGKEHFQCVLWFKEKQNATKLRNWWNGKTSKTDQPVSLTSAKKIKSLAKYTTKDGQFTTNLTNDEMKLIGKWSPKVKAAEWSELLDEHAKKYSTQWCGDHNKYTEDPPLKQFLSYMLDFYRSNQKRPSRATLQYISWKHGYMTNNYLINNWFK